VEEKAAGGPRRRRRPAGGRRRRRERGGGGVGRLEALTLIAPVSPSGGRREGGGMMAIFDLNFRAVLHGLAISLLYLKHYILG
jgi:hypothetical protein